jgi:hypothetical protein
MNWARLLKRVFDIDVEHCPHCGGHLKIIGVLPVAVREWIGSARYVESWGPLPI